MVAAMWRSVGQLARLRSRARTFGEVPAHIPLSSESAKAYSKQSCRTGQAPQISATSAGMTSPLGNQRSVSAPLQAARDHQAASLVITPLLTLQPLERLPIPIRFRLAGFITRLVQVPEPVGRRRPGLGWLLGSGVVSHGHRTADRLKKSAI